MDLRYGNMGVADWTDYHGQSSGAPAGGGAVPGSDSRCRREPASPGEGVESLRFMEAKSCHWRPRPPGWRGNLGASPGFIDVITSSTRPLPLLPLPATSVLSNRNTDTAPRLPAWGRGGVANVPDDTRSNGRYEGAAGGCVSDVWCSLLHDGPAGGGESMMEAGALGVQLKERVPMVGGELPHNHEMIPSLQEAFHLTWPAFHRARSRTRVGGRTFPSYQATSYKLQATRPCHVGGTLP
jgi:hypothetical protein